MKRGDRTDELRVVVGGRCTYRRHHLPNLLVGCACSLERERLFCPIWPCVHFLAGSLWIRLGGRWLEVGGC